MIIISYSITNFFLQVKTFFKFLTVLIIIGLTSCASTSGLVTRAVSYQSVRSVQNKGSVPSNAKIIVGYSITPQGQIVGIVMNQTDDIMIIDQTQSFFVNTNGLSMSYYDPTIHSSSNTTFSSYTEGATVNLGAIAGALGIGGRIGGALSGVTVGGAETNGTSTTNTITFADQPQIRLAPHSHGALSKNFQITGVGKESIFSSQECVRNFSSTNASLRFSVCISYSFDGTNFKKLITEFYVNSQLTYPVTRTGNVNDVLRVILQRKPDAINEQWWMIQSVCNMGYNDNIYEGSFVDWQ